MKKILIIDDEEQIRETLQVLLERKGYEVVLAHNTPLPNLSAPKNY